MLKITRSLMERSPKTAYGAYYEQALYNQILPSIAPDTGMMNYYLSLRPGHFKTYNAPEGASWCCVGTGIENTPEYNDGIYFKKNDNMWVNLYLPSQVDWTEKGMVVSQLGDLLKTNSVQFTVTAPTATQANLNFRIPAWADGQVSVKINGTDYTGPVVRSEYLALDRVWQNGDQVEITMAKKLYIRRSSDDPSMVSIFYGPIMLVGRMGTSGMPASDLATGVNPYSGYSDPTVPAIDALSADPSQWLELIDPDTLTFRAVNAGGANNIEFSPFYDVHHERYSVYWKLNAPAGTRTWRGGGVFNDWSDPTNWDIAPCSSDTLQFDGTTTTTANNNLASNTSINGITFKTTAGAFTITGNSFTLTGNIVNNSVNTQTINTPLLLAGGSRTLNAAAGDIVLGGSIGGSGSMIKTGNHALTLRGNNLSLGTGAAVLEGSLRIDGTTVTGEVNNQATVVFDQTRSGSMKGNILGSGNVIKTGVGDLALLNASHYAGSTTIQQGLLRLEAVQAPVLAHRWSFNGTLNDSVGTSNASIVDVGANNTTLSATQITLAGGSRSASDYVSLGSNLLPNDSNPITIEMWATQKSAQNWSRIFDFGSSSSENLFMSWTQGTSINTDRIEWVDSTGKTTSDNTNAPYTLNQEYHIVMVVEPGAGQSGKTRVSWYSSPSSSATCTMKGSFETLNTLAQLNDVHNWLGYSHYSGDGTANASYNEFRIWQEALDYSEIQLLQGWGPGP